MARIGTDIKPSDLTPRQGKVLRYVVARTSYGGRIEVDDCIVLIEWSDLPKNHLQAVNTLGKLTKLGLVVKDDKGYSATAKGKKLMVAANKARKWMKAPPPAVTNKPTKRSSNVSHSPRSRKRHRA